MIGKAVTHGISMSGTAQAIVDAAERRIRDAGYNGFSFRDIATEIGIKSASVHYHFPTKEALAASVAHRYTERFLKAITDEVAQGGELTKVWVAGFRKALDDDAKMCLCGALGAASRDLPDEVLNEARRFFELGLDNLKKGGLTETRAMQVLALLEGAMLLSIVLDDTTAFDAATAEITSF